MTATLEEVAKKKPVAVVRQPMQRGWSLTGLDGLLKQRTKSAIEAGEEMTDHLGYEKHGPARAGSGNVHNGDPGQDGADRPAGAWGSTCP